MKRPTQRSTGAPARRAVSGSRVHRELADFQDATHAAPNSTGIPMTPTRHAPGAAWVDLNQMQGGAPCLDEAEIPDE